MTPRTKRTAAVLAAVVVLLLLGATATKWIPWVLGGFGLLAGARRVLDARKSAGAAGRDNRRATEDRNDRVRKLAAERDQDLAAAAADPAPVSTPPVDAADRARRRQELGSWDD